MTKWIRWGGLLAFLCVIGVVAAFWLLFIDGIVERAIESEGTRLVGAQVDLSGADLSLVPAGLTLTRLQVTNPDEPMTNAVEIARVAMTLDGLNLVRRKVLIEEMTIDGLQFGTPRTSSGAVTPKPKDEPSLAEQLKQGIPFSMPTFEVPNVKDILEKEDLETLELVESLKKDIQQERDTWAERLKDLPGKDTFEKYEARLKKLKAAPKGGLGGILGGVAEIQALQEEIQRDIDNLNSAHNDFEAQFASLKQRFDQAVKAPQADLRRLQEKYSLSPRGLANMSGLLLGQQISRWTHTGLVWYEKSKPLLERVKHTAGGSGGPEVVEPLRRAGVDVRFQELEPVPDFLIRKAKVSLNLELGDVSGRIENVTPDQDVLGKPLTFDFTGDRLKGVKSVTLRGNLNHMKPDKSHDRINLQAIAYKLPRLPLSEQPEWPVALDKGLADVKIRAGIKGETLNARLNGNFKSLRIVAGKPDDSNILTQALSSAISGISSLSVRVDITGTIDTYNVKIASDLDRILQRAAGRMVRDLSNRFQKELSREISRKVNGPLQDLRGTYGGLNQIGLDLTGRVTQGNDVLESLLKKSISPKGLPGGLKLPF